MNLFNSVIFITISYLTPSNGFTNELVSIDEKYKSGVQAYTDDRWSECINELEETIHLNKLYNAVVTNCGQRCKEESFKPMVKDKIEDLAIYELYLRRTECLLDCRMSGLRDLNMDPDVSYEVLDNLAALEPYNYIHLCYFRMNLLPKAATASYTYLLAHPGDTQMKHNYEYYIRQPEVNEDEVMDLESDDYKFLYWQGVQAYEKKQWAETVSTMEEVLDDYFASENKCRLACEGLDNQNWQHKFNNMADYFVFLLNCKQKCQKSVKSMGFDSGLDFIAHVLNHIQIGYYHQDMPKKAARAVQSYLYLFPEDKEMLENKNIYGVLIKEEDFVEKPEIVFYHKRDKYERKLLNYYSTMEDTEGSIESAQ